MHRHTPADVLAALRTVALRNLDLHDIWRRENLAREVPVEGVGIELDRQPYTVFGRVLAIPDRDFDRVPLRGPLRPLPPSLM